MISSKTLTIIPVIFFIFSFLTLVLVNESYGITHNRQHPSFKEVSLQLEVRNSNGNLVVYFEPNLMYIIDLNGIHEFLDAQSNKTKIFKQGQSLELIQYSLFGRFNSYAQISSMDMIHQGKAVLAMRHDGYIAEPGDTWKASWKILRTSD